MSEEIIKTEYSEIMRKSYIDYAMSVICSRAVPDVRDGLKPVQRRVLYAMSELGLKADKPHRKSARIVGDTMGKYHPHGDSSIYETLVVLSQDFKKEMPLVDGHGNFGSIEGDTAAAMRYTEARLEEFTQNVYLADLDKNVVDFVPNFDETEREPSVLPVRVPNVLVNGSEGIAVGMTTSIPTHNLSEVIEAMIAYMRKNSITCGELMEYLPGPDFPTGGIVVNKSELKDIYESGTGRIKIRGKVTFEPAKKKGERDKLVITEIPYTMIGANINKFLIDMCDLAEKKMAADIVNISNESDKDGIRIVLELRKGADAARLENMLYKKTRLEDTFGVNMLVIANGRPEVMGLKDILKCSADFQYEINTRKYTTLLEKDREQIEIKAGLIEACDIIDLIIEIIRGSQNVAQAKNCLTGKDSSEVKFKSEESRRQAGELKFTEKQAQAILELRLSKLIGLEIMKLKEEHKELVSEAERFEKLLSDKSAMKKEIISELRKIQKEYAAERKTRITDAETAVFEEEKIEEREVVFLMDRFGYVKLIEPSVYDKNTAAVDAENKYVFRCMNTDSVCVFTQNGLMHQVKCLKIPSRKLKDKGVPVDNLSNYTSSEESIVRVFSAAKLKMSELLFTTKAGMMKFVDGGEFDVSRKTVTATKLTEGDEVVSIEDFDASDRKVYAQAYPAAEGGAAALPDRESEEVSPLLSGGSEGGEGELLSGGPRGAGGVLITGGFEEPDETGNVFGAFSDEDDQLTFELFDLSGGGSETISFDALSLGGDEEGGAQGTLEEGSAETEDEKTTVVEEAAASAQSESGPQAQSENGQPAQSESGQPAQSESGPQARDEGGSGEPREENPEAAPGKEEFTTNKMVVLQTRDGVFLRFRLSEVPEKKKGAVGVRGIKLADGDEIDKVYVIGFGDKKEIEYHGKNLELMKIKLQKRAAKGSRPRV